MNHPDSVLFNIEEISFISQQLDKIKKELSRLPVSIDVQGNYVSEELEDLKSHFSLTKRNWRQLL